MIITVINATLAVAKRKPEKNSGLNGIRTHDLSDTGVVLYQLSYQAINFWHHINLSFHVVKDVFHIDFLPFVHVIGNNSDPPFRQAILLQKELIHSLCWVHFKHSPLYCLFSPPPPPLSMLYEICDDIQSSQHQH